jgi:hypothetical protein
MTTQRGTYTIVVSWNWFNTFIAYMLRILSLSVTRARNRFVFGPFCTNLCRRAAAHNCSSWSRWFIHCSRLAFLHSCNTYLRWTFKNNKFAPKDLPTYPFHYPLTRILVRLSGHIICIKNNWLPGRINIHKLLDQLSSKEPHTEFTGWFKLRGQWMYRNVMYP